MRIALSGRIAIAAIVAAAALATSFFSAGAQEHVWKHGLINAKADAGIFLMVSTRDFAKKEGLKLGVSQFKDDQLALKALIAGELDSFEGGPQGVFAADIATGIVSDRHDDDGVDHGVGEFGGFERLVHGHLTDGIAAIGDYDDHFAAVAWLQPLGAEVDSVVHRGSGLAMHQFEAGIERLEVGLPVALLEQLGASRLRRTQPRRLCHFATSMSIHAPHPRALRIEARRGYVSSRG